MLKDLRRLMQTGGDGTRNTSDVHLELLGQRGVGQIDESGGCCRQFHGAKISMYVL